MSHVPISTGPATNRRVMKPPCTRSEFGLNGSEPKSGSPPEVTSNVSDAADPEPIGFLTTKQWKADACPTTASESTATADTARSFSRISPLSEYNARARIAEAHHAPTASSV